ncbi:MAG: PaaI family thioesterase [Myxococcota bacterium]
MARYSQSQEEPPASWLAKRKLAESLRDLLSSLCSTDAPEEQLHAITGQVSQTADLLRAQPEMVERPGVAEGSLAAGMEMFHDRSPVVGLSNPLAPPALLEPNFEKQLVSGSVFFGPAYEGAPGCVHGGFLAAVLDEALGMACVFSGEPGMTGELTVRYVKPTPVEHPLRIEARFDRKEGRKIYNSGEIYAGELKVVESKGVFISIPRERFEELRAARLARQQDASKA